MHPLNLTLIINYLGNFRSHKLFYFKIITNHRSLYNSICTVNATMAFKIKYGH